MLRNIFLLIVNLIPEYQVDLDYNDVEADEESFDEIRMVLPGTLSVEDIR